MDDLQLESDEGLRSEQRIGQIKSALPQLCDDHAWIPRFLLALRTSDSVREACEIAGISRQTAFAMKNAFPSFAKAWVDAEQDAVDELAAAARQRALAKSDSLMIFLLKARRPEVYDRRLAGPNAPVATFQITFNEKTRIITSAEELTDEELQGIAYGELEVAGDISALFGPDEEDEEFGDDSRDDDTV